MSNLYGASHHNSFRPTSPSVNSNENRRSFLDLNQPLTSMGRREPSQIPAIVPNIYLPQLTFSPAYHPTTQNFQVVSHQEFDRSEDTHISCDQDNRFRRHQPAGSIAYYVADNCCDSPLGLADWDPSSPPVSATTTCGSFQLYDSAEGSVELLYQFPYDDQFPAFDVNTTFCDSYYGAANSTPYHSQHPAISPTQRSSYSELSANIRYLTELRRAESKTRKSASTPSEPSIQKTSTKAKRKERPSDSDLDSDFEPHCPSPSRRRSAPASVKQKVAAAPPRAQSTAPLPKSHPPKKTEEQKRLSLACLFCRERKIACGRPSEDEPDQTCSQCMCRELTCEYPKESRRGQHKRGPKTGEKAGRC